MRKDWIKDELVLSLGYYFFIYQKNTRLNDVITFTNDLNKKTKMDRSYKGIKMRFSNFDMLNPNKASKGFKNTGNECKIVWNEYVKSGIPSNKLKEEFLIFVKTYASDIKMYSKYIKELEELKFIDLDDLDLLSSDEIGDSDIVESLDYSPKAKPEVATDVKNNKYVRNRNESMKVIKFYNYKCNLDPSHVSFVGKNDKQYMEAHHLIPFANQDYYDNSLDCAANIICLCPNCHRKLHHGKNIVEELKKLYSDRKDKLEKSGIKVSFDDLLKYYE